MKLWEKGAYLSNGKLVENLAGANAALAASIFHYKEIEIPELKKYLRDCNVPVRI